MKLLLPSLALVTMLAACEPAPVDPELTVLPVPRTIDGLGQASTIRLSALDAKAKPGTGTVRVTSTAGSLKDGADVTLAAGEGSIEFTCARTADPACMGSIRISAEWMVGGASITATSSVNVSVPVVDAGIDAGMQVDAGVPDGGTVIALGADKTQIIAGVGDISVITATVTAGGAPLTGQTVSFSTSSGRIGPVGGSPGNTMFSAATDAMGQAKTQLVAGSMDTSPARITATVASGATTTLDITVVSVSQIGYVSTVCPQTTMNCNLMGLQGSGFNETALLRFKVSDGLGAGVSGVRVDFSLIGAPAGTTVDPTATTNAMGEAQANVRAGTTVGTFTVQASALNGMFTVTSPTIGVRGAKASNRGFTLRCDRVNLATYVAVVPPLPITNNCTVGLTDRYGNPVGTGTQVRLNSEAGTVPNNVTTAAFMPGGSNANEGLGTFVFSTLGVFPAVDVAPFAADSAQFPIARAGEPSAPNGGLTANPRDGMVTMIAYLQGEEDFRDDNSNGVRDSNEQFIDQGEPFLDANDNNTWDMGEFFVDTPPSDGGMPNNMWDGPNGSWDSNAQIWTEFRLLYTGYASSQNAMLTLANTRTSGGSYGTVFAGTSKFMNIFASDLNLNRPEPGTTLAARFVPSTRGSTQITTSNTALDGYGFEFQRLLVNPSGTGTCSTTELVCRWRNVFGAWGEGYVGIVQLTAGTAPAMSTPQTLIVESNTRGTISNITAVGTVE